MRKLPMLTDSERRAAALAVIRFGVDKTRIKETARTVKQAQAEGQAADLLNSLVTQNLLSPVQAEEIRFTLGRTQVDPDRPLPAPRQAAVSKPAKTNGVAETSAAVPELRRLGKYQILRRLGEGGMGAVYLGYDEEPGRQVAIKVLSDQLAGNQAYVDRFQREARSVLHLEHANIVRGIEVGEDQATGAHFLVLEFVDGPSAHALLDRFGRLPVGDAVHIVLDIAHALEHAHSRNVIHRDIKPDNILLSQSGVAKLSDLGLARRIDENSHLTGARQGFGTPYYMPYEQSINARRADARSDIYALGATLYHLLTGEVPFPGAGALEVAQKKQTGQFTSVRTVRPEIPESLERVIDKMLALSPQKRYQTASDLIVDLERTGLAAPMPSFVDPAVALQDPHVRQRLTTAPEPTRLDLGASAAGAVQRDPELWYLRFPGEQGRWRKARATTAQIRQRLFKGQISVTVEASHDPRGEFQPLGAFLEFRQFGLKNGQSANPKSQAGDELKPAVITRLKKPARVERRNAGWLLPTVLALGLALALLTCYFMFLR
jgi:serine/threonine-protein kinase